MKLDRNINADGSGRYALIDLRKLRAGIGSEESEDALVVRDALGVLEAIGALHYGGPYTKYEFFPVILKDINAEAALTAYANSADSHDVEFANEVREMAARSGPYHPHFKIPD